MVGIAIIGCGGIARNRHIPALSMVPEARLAGFYNRTRARAEECASRYGGKVYESFEEVLSDPQVDAVVVCTAARSHCDYTVRALLAGKHVLCEKPMAVTAKDCEKMVEAAKQSGKKLMISHNQRRYEPHRKAKELLEKGEIGRLLTFRTFLGIKGPEYASVYGNNNAYFNKEESGRGVMSDVGSHRIDLMRWMTGAEYDRVFTYAPTLEKTKPDGSLIDVDDNSMSIVEMDNGVVGLIVSSWTSMGGEDRITQLFGTEGTITLYRKDHPVVVEYKDGTTAYYDFPENPDQSQTALTDIDRLFVEAIEKDTEPLVTGEDGLAVLRLLDAMDESNKTGRWVKVNHETL